MFTNTVGLWFCLCSVATQLTKLPNKFYPVKLQPLLETYLHWESICIYYARDAAHTLYCITLIFSCKLSNPLLLRNQAWYVNSLTTVGYWRCLLSYGYLPWFIFFLLLGASTENLSQGIINIFSVGSRPWTHPLTSEHSIVRALRSENAPLD